MTRRSAHRPDGEATVAHATTPVAPKTKNPRRRNRRKRNNGVKNNNGMKVNNEAKIKQPNDPELPPEVLALILDNVQDASTMCKVARTCKKFHSLITPRLHKRLAYQVDYDLVFVKFIAVMQRYLSVQQNRKLITQCRCPGQKEGVHYGSDLGATPPCAAYVRELIIGPFHVFRKGEHMVYRYLEEVFKNMHGLEIVELWTITASMAKTLPGLTNLKALSLTAQKARDGDKITALAKVKSLQHFKIRAWEPIEEFEVATKSILLNSRLTLRSLAIMNLDDVAGYRFRFLDSWQRELGSDSPTPYFPALQSLQLIGLEGPGEGLKRAFENAVNFMNLRSLSLERIYAGRSALYRHLADLAARTPKEDIKLRSFEMDHHSDATLDEHRHDMETICRFLGSFGSLTSLHVLEYDKYLPISQQDKGLLPDPVQQAILKHKNLTSLTLRSRDSFNRANMHPYLSPDVIGTIVDSLPLLEEFDFFARPQDMVQVGEALARGRNLTTISVAQVDRASKLFVPRELVTKILGGILDGRGGGSRGGGHFRWGDHSKLRRIIIDRMFPDNKRIFDIASWFPEVRAKGDRRYQKPFSIRGFQNTEREVLGQDVTMLLRPEDMELASNCDWADDVARDMI